MATLLFQLSATSGHTKVFHMILQKRQGRGSQRSFTMFWFCYQLNLLHNKYHAALIQHPFSRRGRLVLHAQWKNYWISNNCIVRDLVIPPELANRLCSILRTTRETHQWVRSTLSKQPCTAIAGHGQLSVYTTNRGQPNSTRYTNAVNITTMPGTKKWLLVLSFMCEAIAYPVIFTEWKFSY